MVPAPLHVHAHGDATQPTLLLLHGFGDSGECWPSQVQRWSRDWYVVLPDQRGHGASPRWTAEELAAGPAAVLVDDVVALLERLARETGRPRAVLAGHSMGGAVAACVAATRPDLVHGLLVEDPPWFADWPQRQRPDPAAAAERVSWVRGLHEAEPAQRLATVREESPAWTDDEHAAWARSKAQCDLGLCAEPTAHALLQPWPDTVAALESHRTPTLVVGGDAEGALVTPEVMADVEEIGGASVAVTTIQGAGHSVRRDRREDFHAVVDPWLAALRPGAPPAR